MPYYDLEPDGRIRGSYIEKPLNISTIELPDPNIEYPMWNGKDWVDFRSLKYRLESLCSQVSVYLHSMIAVGFSFNGHQFQADQTAQICAIGVLTELNKDENSLPITWRTSDNKMIEFLKAEEFSAFVKEMQFFLQTSYSKVWEIKDKIRSSTNIEEAEEVLTEFKVALNKLKTS